VVPQEVRIVEEERGDRLFMAAGFDLFDQADGQLEAGLLAGNRGQRVKTRGSDGKLHPLGPGGRDDAELN
jgi:hypothetical protein